MKKSTREALDAYYQEAGSWAADRAGALTRSRRIAWIVAAVAVTVALAEAFALMLLMPLKTAVPYTLLVDRTTGYVQALDPLQPGRTTPDNALIQSMLAQYVIARESFNVDIVQNDYRKVGLWSADQARSDYQAFMQPTNVDSPLNRYPRSTVIETRIKSVSPLSDATALVRFETEQRQQGSARGQVAPWVAVVRYRFSGEPMSTEDRFLNPLGFQVTAYRRDAEALPIEPVDADTDAASYEPVVTPSELSPDGAP